MCRAFNTTLRVYLFQLSGLAADSLPILNQFSVDQAAKLAFAFSLQCHQHVCRFPAR
jgi:hypothetical protein